MTQSELIEELFDRLPPFYKLRLPRSTIKMVIKIMFDIIMEQLLICEPVQIYGYGILNPKVIRGRRFRDKDTNEIKDAKPFLQVNFRLSRRNFRELSKKMVRGNDE